MGGKAGIFEAFGGIFVSEFLVFACEHFYAFVFTFLLLDQSRHKSHYVVSFLFFSHSFAQMQIYCTTGGRLLSKNCYFSLQR